MIADGKIARLDPQKVIIAHERRIVKSQVVFIHDNLQKSLSYFSYFKNELDDSDILAELLLVATYEARNMMLKFNRSYNQGNINKDRERLHHSIGDNMYGNDYIKKKLKDIMSNLAIMKHSNYFHNIMGGVKDVEYFENLINRINFYLPLGSKFIFIDEYELNKNIANKMYYLD